MSDRSDTQNFLASLVREAELPHPDKIQFFARRPDVLNEVLKAAFNSRSFKFVAEKWYSIEIPERGFTPSVLVHLAAIGIEIDKYFKELAVRHYCNMPSMSLETRILLTEVVKETNRLDLAEDLGNPLTFRDLNQFCCYLLQMQHYFSCTHRNAVAFYEEEGKIMLIELNLCDGKRKLSYTFNHKKIEIGTVVLVPR